MGKRKSGRGWIWTLTAIPVAFALAGLGASDWMSAGVLLQYMGRLTGIAGLTLLLGLAAAGYTRRIRVDR